MDAFDLAAQMVGARDGIEAQLAMLARKDCLVRAAHAAGIRKMEIHRLTGIARTTIDRILAEGE